MSFSASAAPSPRAPMVGKSLIAQWLPVARAGGTGKMRWGIPMLARVAVFLAIVFCADTAVAFDADTARTWQRAWIIPQPGWLMRMDEPRAREWLASLSAPRPVYLFFHGSAGFLRVTDVKRYGYLTRAGFIVIAPDSFARAGRQGGRTERYIRYRHEEMAYALDRILPRRGPTRTGSSWRASRRGRSPSRASRQVVIAPPFFTDRTANPSKPRFHPTGDPGAVAPGSLRSGLPARELGHRTCAETLRGRAGSYVVEFPGGGHNVFDNPDKTKAPDAVVKFLRDNGLVAQPLPKSAMPRLRSPTDPRFDRDGLEVAGAPRAGAAAGPSAPWPRQCCRLTRRAPGSGPVADRRGP